MQVGVTCSEAVPCLAGHPRCDLFESPRVAVSLNLCMHMISAGDASCSSLCLPYHPGAIHVLAGALVIRTRPLHAPLPTSVHDMACAVGSPACAPSWPAPIPTCTELMLVANTSPASAQPTQ
jgi:hypothetical protein